MKRCAVVGGGIIGIAVARELLGRFPGLEVVVYEKEDGLAHHQTGHNSGVVHAGLYYEPGSLKATLCRRGVGLLKEFCEQAGLPYQECGKLVVARDSAEVGRLENVMARAVANGVPDVRMITGPQIREIEPGAIGVSAIHSPTTAITDFPAVTDALAAEVRRTGGDVRLNQEVAAIRPSGSRAEIRTADGRSEHYDQVYVCAGLQSDRLAPASRTPALRVVPFFGQYQQVDERSARLLSGLIYPVPDPRYPFLGVHLTKRVDGGMTLGPNAFLSLSRERYRGVGLDLRDVANYLGYPGFWRFAASNSGAALREVRSLVAKNAFRQSAAEYVPALAEAELTPMTRGIRAQVITDRGALVDDFRIDSIGPVTHLRNAPSPGATSALAIAEHLVDAASGS